MANLEKPLIVKSIHDFVVQLTEEWNRVKRVFLVGIGASFLQAIILARFILRYTWAFIQRELMLDLALMICSLICIGLILVVFLQEYKHYSLWQDRFNRILEYERKLLGEG